MAYQQYGWSASGQADEPNTWVTEGSGHDGAVDAAAVWDNSACIGPHTPPDLTNTGDEFVYGRLLGNTPTLGQPRADEGESQLRTLPDASPPWRRASHGRLIGS
ncbi:hypothetical protein RRF57_004719 [Xylaria bambusicola]|uniref:Uncharacterized protein n=1 Tax=Xylaria bambusicola TaxID=326684 RepID=A0AAN7UIN1_9PEZI